MSTIVSLISSNFTVWLVASIYVQSTILILGATLLSWRWARSAWRRHFLWAFVLLFTALVPLQPAFYHRTLGTLPALRPDTNVQASAGVNVVDAGTHRGSSATFGVPVSSQQPATLAPMAPGYERVAKRDGGGSYTSAPASISSRASEVASTGSPPLIVPLANKLVSWFVGIWCAGLAVGFIRLFWGLTQLAGIVRNSVECEDASVRGAAEEMGLRFNCSVPRIRHSNACGSPMMMGYFRPQIILPSYCLELSQNRIRHILAHELAHIRRKDIWVGLAQRCLLILFWPQPLLRRASAQLGRAREELCDQAVRQVDSAVQYVDTLVMMAEKRQSKPTPVLGMSMFSSAGDLEARVERLIRDDGCGTVRAGVWTRLGACLLGMALFLVGGRLSAVTAPQTPPSAPQPTPEAQLTPEAQPAPEVQPTPGARTPRQNPSTPSTAPPLTTPPPQTQPVPLADPALETQQGPPSDARHVARLFQLGESQIRVLFPQNSDVAFAFETSVDLARFLGQGWRLFEGRDLAPERWIPETTMVYGTLHVELSSALPTFAKVVNHRVDSAGFVDDVLHSIRQDPNGPQIDLRRDLIAHLGERISFATGLAGVQNSWLVVLHVANRPAVEDALRRIAAPDPLIDAPTQADGGIFFRVASQGIFPGIGFGVVTDASQHQLIVASDYDLLRRLFRDENPRSLVNHPAQRSLQRVADRDLGAGHGRIYARGGLTELDRLWEMLAGDPLPSQFRQLPGAGASVVNIQQSGKQVHLRGAVLPERQSPSQRTPAKRGKLRTFGDTSNSLDDQPAGASDQ